MNKLNIWLIKVGEQLPVKNDIRKMRTLMLSEKLAGKGHEITLWSSAYNHFDKKWLFKKTTEYKVGSNFKVIAIKGFGYKKNISLARVFDHRIISRKFKKLSSKKKSLI